MGPSWFLKLHPWVAKYCGASWSVHFSRSGCSLTPCLDAGPHALQDGLAQGLRDTAEGVTWSQVPWVPQLWDTGVRTHRTSMQVETAITAARGHCCPRGQAKTQRVGVRLTGARLGHSLQELGCSSVQRAWVQPQYPEKGSSVLRAPAMPADPQTTRGQF